MNNEEITLLPCPFCGGTNIVISDYAFRGDGEDQFPQDIVCMDCPSGFCGHDFKGKGLAGIVSAWNRRPAPAQLSDDIHEVKALIEYIIKNLDNGHEGAAYACAKTALSTLSRAIAASIGDHFAGGGKPISDEETNREEAPPNSLPNWSECALRVENSDFIEKRVAGGGYGAEPDSLLASELHRFIYEYDDADPYRSAWFMHRLEKLLDETRALLARCSDENAIKAKRYDWLRKKVCSLSLGMGSINTFDFVNLPRIKDATSDAAADLDAAIDAAMAKVKP